jgi:hypothetical protein
MMNIPDSLVKHLQSQLGLLSHNEILFEINEGNMLPYVKAALQKQLRGKCLEKALHRIAPINLLKKIIDKLSKIYDGNVKREVIGGTPSDDEMLAYVEKSISANTVMGLANEFFNLFKNTLVQPYVYNMQPYCRTIPSHQFTVYSENAIVPNEPTHIIICHKMIDERMTYRVYTDDEFIIIDSEGRPVPEEMARIESDGTNEYGVIPFIYINRSQNLLIPRPDTDTLALTLLTPVLLTDLNFAAMFQTFSILYGINLDFENLEISPAVFWNFKAKDGEQKPELGSIKPQVDIDQVIRLIVTELSLWLNSRGIKPGSIGNLNQDNAASGISKMIDEMDTTSDRIKQVQIFQPAEKRLWNLILKNMMPVWQKNGLVDNKTVFTQSAEVETAFGDQMPATSRTDIISEQKAELEAGLTTRARAIKRLNPKMSDKEIEELQQEIEASREVISEQATENNTADTSENIQE